MFNNTATEYIDSYGVLWYIRSLLRMMPDAKKTRLECEGWFEVKARGVNKWRRGKIAGFRKAGTALKALV